MSNVQDTINDLAQGLYRADVIDKKTLRNLTDEDLPVLHEFTGEEIQQLRKKQKLSQSVFAKYLNVSPAMVRGLEQGKRHAHGAILKLLNIVERHGIGGLL
ncbi:helix-turn-helix domain-containing protein [Legionella erythra]|uniref:Helix-turn-helix protein n=1 Tax=Legionella erythra TaxID=448 RepID=A0A0W0TGF1_LEGER|nr:helix-turn-helix domain-containing protein [Legionella erythra]KTC94700.1 helix-turn-helix protein [Legionella erythra]